MLALRAFAANTLTIGQSDTRNLTSDSDPAPMARRHKTRNAGSPPSTDMSPMIDLVFLLLIFFMIVSQKITYPKDPNVKPPIATHAQVPKKTDDRVILNVYADGTVKEAYSGKEYTLEEVTVLMEKARSEKRSTRLHLRADQEAPHRHVQAVMDASAAGGVSNVIFSTYVTDK